MKTDNTKSPSDAAEGNILPGENRFDPLEEGVRSCIPGFIDELIKANSMPPSIYGLFWLALRYFYFLCPALVAALCSIAGSQVPPVHAGIKVCGSVEDLLLDSRENAVEVIVVVLHLSAVDRITKILEQLHSSAADLCLITDLAGLDYTTAQFGRTGNSHRLSA